MQHLLVGGSVGSAAGAAVGVGVALAVEVMTFGIAVSYMSTAMAVSM